MSLIITHSEAEGTLLLGTTRGDGTAELVKSLGWRWGRSIGVWFVPRSREAVPKRVLIEETADALREAGFDVDVRVDASAEDRADRETRLAERSQDRVRRLTARAEREQGKSDARDAAGRAIADQIPLGQPILVGTSAQARQERDARRIAAHFSASVQHQRNANAAVEAARTAAAANGARHNPVTVANRIGRLEATIRRLERDLELVEGHTGTDSPDEGSRRRRRLELGDAVTASRADLAYWRAVREQQIGDGTATNYSRETVQPGDYVRIGGHWRKVVRCNPKTVAVETGFSWTDTAPWARVQDHRPMAP